MANDIETAFGAHALDAARQRLLCAAQAMPVGWFGRRAALYLRKAALFHGPAVIDAQVEGLKFRLYMRDNVSERKFLFMPQFCDPYERARLREILEGGEKDGAVFVDVGANAGIYSLTAAAQVGDGGRVLAIEPNPAVLARLTFNAALNGFEKRITTVQSGVSDAEGSFDLILDDSNLGGSSLALARGKNKITVDCHRLLTLVEKNGLKKIDALKIDIEGAEDKALVPFFATAPEALHPRLIILENSPKDWALDVTGALKKVGYALEKTARMNQVWIKPENA